MGLTFFSGCNLQLFYGDSEPVFVVDSSPYPHRSRASSYGSDRYYSGRPGSAGGYYRGSSYGRSSDYYTGDRYTDIDGYRGSDYYRSRPDYYASDPYYSGSQTAAYGAAYDDTYFDSKPYEYYDYRRPSVSSALSLSALSNWVSLNSISAAL